MRIVTKSGSVVDIQWSGFGLNLFLSREDKRDTEKIAIDISMTDAINVAALILTVANNPPPFLPAPKPGEDYPPSQKAFAEWVAALEFER